MQDRLLDAFSGHLVVACSGGADSLALAHLAIARAKSNGTPLPIIAHVNHGLRPEAAQEAEDVQRFAHSHGAVCQVRAVSVPLQGASLEARAREARYSALDACAAETGASWVLLAHTQSDQAETVFMRIVRGTGLVGLAGMSVTRGLYARPLLGKTREDTEAYCEKHKLRYVRDPMNRDPRFTRVRIRHQWLTQLREENPRVSEALCGLADAARGHREVLDWAANTAIQDLVTDSGLHVGQAFAQLPDALATRVLVLFVQRNATRQLERSHIAALIHLCRAPTDGSHRLSLPGGEVVRVYDHLSWSSREQSAAQSTAVQVPDGFKARHWRAGDRMRPRRLKGKSRKLSDLFADAKVPASDRAQAWVVTSGDGNIVWEIGRAHV